MKLIPDITQLHWSTAAYPECDPNCPYKVCHRCGGWIKDIYNDYLCEECQEEIMNEEIRDNQEL